jgi:hypothetical protein
MIFSKPFFISTGKVTATNNGHDANVINYAYQFLVSFLWSCRPAGFLLGANFCVALAGFGGELCVCVCAVCVCVSEIVCVGE